MRNKLFYAYLPLVVLFILGGCKVDKEADLTWLTNPGEKMELTVSATDIELDRDRPNEVAVSFEWTPAREMPEDYAISYVTKIDIEGHEFESCVRVDEDYGVFNKSYTTEELQMLLVDKWGQNYSKVVPVQFRVIAKWEGGPRYAMPEVRTVTVNVRPYRPLVWEANRIVLSGTSTDNDKLVMSKTMENEFQYAFVQDLVQGEMGIALETEQGESYIQLAEGVNNWVDGEEVDVVLGDEPAMLNLPKDGEYRVILNTETRKLKIYSPDKKLEPYKAHFKDKLNGWHDVDVTNLWAYGDITKWGNDLKGGGFKPSLVDPQLLVGKISWTSAWGGGSDKKENGKFVLDVPHFEGGYPGGPHFSWCLVPVIPDDILALDKSDSRWKYKQELKLNTWTPIHAESEAREQYREAMFTWYMRPLLTIVDLRNMRIYMSEY